MITIFRYFDLSWRFLIDRRGRSVVQESPIAITEILSIPPGGVETYHVPVARGDVLNVEINAAAPLQIRLLDEETWRAARTLDARLSVFSHFDVCGRTAQVQFVAPNPGGYMLLLCNPALTTNNALVVLSSELVPSPYRNASETNNPTGSSMLNEASQTLAALARLFSSRD